MLNKFCIVSLPIKLQLQDTYEFTFKIWHLLASGKKTIDRITLVELKNVSCIYLLFERLKVTILCIVNNFF